MFAADPGVGSDVTTSGGDQNSQLRSELEQLKQLVHQQQDRIAALEAQQSGAPAARGLESSLIDIMAPTSEAAPPPIAGARFYFEPLDGTAQQPGGQNQGSSDERVRNLERRIKGLGPLSFSGDIRMRAETLQGGPSDGSLDVNRGRYRARFNVFADLGKQFQAGLSLATGDVNNPISTNQNIGVFYSRKAFALDLAYVTYAPSYFKPLTLTAGKFRYPWYNTELVWDKDLNPEGAAQTLAFKLDNTPFLKRIAVVGFELPFAESQSTTTPTSKNIVQSMMYGGQLQTTFEFTKRLRASAYVGYYDFQNADTIAQALAKASSKNPQTPWSGALPLTGGNAPQNSIYTIASANVVTINGKSYPTGVANVVSAQFGSKFGLLDIIGRLDWDTGKPKLPVSILGDFVQNTRACANVGNWKPVPANTASILYTSVTTAPCNPAQRRGYWLEARVGRLLEKGDWQGGYTRIFLDREAVISNFNYSEMRQGTNVTTHRFDVFYMFQSNIQLGFLGLVGRPIGANPVTGKTEPWLTRLEFDTVYIF